MENGQSLRLFEVVVFLPLVSSSPVSCGIPILFFQPFGNRGLTGSVVIHDLHHHLVRIAKHLDIVFWLLCLEEVRKIKVQICHCSCFVGFCLANFNKSDGAPSDDMKRMFKLRAS